MLGRCVNRCVCVRVISRCVCFVLCVRVVVVTVVLIEIYRSERKRTALVTTADARVTRISVYMCM